MGLVSIQYEGGNPTSNCFNFYTITMEETNKIELTQADLDAKIKAAVKAREGEMEQWVQKLTSKTKLQEKILTNVWLVAKDWTKLISLYNEDESVANEMLKMYYDGMTIEEYKESIGYKTSQEEMTDEKIAKKANSIYESNKIKEKKAEFIEKLGLDGDALESFEKEFWDRTSMKSFSAETVTDHLTKAYKLSTDFSQDKLDVIKAKKVAAGASWLGGWSATKKADAEKARIDKEVEEFMDKYM